MLFSKTYPSFLTVKEGSTFLTKPLFPQGREDVAGSAIAPPEFWDRQRSLCPQGAADDCLRNKIASVCRLAYHLSLAPIFFLILAISLFIVSNSNFIGFGIPFCQSTHPSLFILKRICSTESIKRNKYSGFSTTLAPVSSIRFVNFVISLCTLFDSSTD